MVTTLQKIKYSLQVSQKKETSYTKIPMETD